MEKKGSWREGKKTGSLLNSRYAVSSGGANEQKISARRRPQRGKVFFEP